MTDWQPIESAPKDRVLLLSLIRKGQLEEVHVGSFSYADSDDEVSCWWSHQSDDEIVPTHWMPLPAPPSPLSHETGDHE